MGMQYKYIDGAYRYWNNVRKIPIIRKRKDGSTFKWFKEIQVELNEVKSYWIYEKVGECYELSRYYNENNNKILVETNMHITPDAVLYRICDHQYKVPVEREHTSVIGPRIQHADYELKWSHELNGKSIIILLTAYPKMSYNEIMMVLTNEGAHVDEQGIIHEKE